jgi:phosphatidylserine/phosphatidylglycerophosphate/cardiolipin synthase-like enzyme
MIVRLAGRPPAWLNQGVSFRAQWLLIVLVLLLLLVAVGAYLYLQALERLPEQAGADRARQVPTAVPGAPTAVLGSGATASSGWYELYFTEPVYPDRPDRHRGGVDEKLVTLIDSARQTIDAADYDFDLENVAQALANARRRGVRVRFVTDTDTWTSTNVEVQRAWSVVKAADIPVVDDQRGPIMHHKFAVVDGQWVWTGSWNWTTGDTYRLNNAAVKIRSPELAASYTAEFEKMFVERKFGPSKPRGVPSPRLNIEGVGVESYFSPKDGVAARIVDRIGRAERSIQFLAFSFTHDGIGSAVIARAKAGVAVRGVFETTGSRTQFSELERMKSQGLEVYTDGNPYVMHHKLFVIDARTVIFGSYNFSSNAETDNDENLLIVDDPRMAEAFLAEVDRVVQTAKSPPVRK